MLNFNLANYRSSKPILSHFNILKRSAVILIGFNFFSVQAFSYEILVVQKGECLSKIVNRYFKPPIYGRKGAITGLLAMNPSIMNPDILYVGQKIVIDVKSGLTPKNLISAHVENLGTTSANSPSQKDGNGSLVAPHHDVQKPSSSPVSLSEEVTSNEDIEISNFKVSFGMKYLKIESTDVKTNGNASFLSEGSPFVDISWKIFFSQKTDSFSEIHFKSVSYKMMSDVRGTYNIDTSNHQLNIIGIKYGQKLSDKSSWYLSVDYGHELFARLPHPDTVVFDHIEMSVIRLGSDVAILKRKKLDFLFKVDGGYVITNDQVKASQGSELNIGLDLTHEILSSVFLSGVTFFRYGEEKSSTSTQEINELGISLGISKRFEP